MFKERENDKIYFGPVWDFDLAFDNNNRVYPTLDKKDFIYKYDISAGTMDDLATKILSNEKVIQRLKETWNGFIEEKVTKKIINDYIEETTNLIYQSQRLNFMRWDILNTKILLNPIVRGSFEAEVEYLKYFMDKRFDILDNIIKNATVESITAKVKKKHHSNNNEKGNKDFRDFNQFLFENEK